jgi:hypothetical protein
MGAANSAPNATTLARNAAGKKNRTLSSLTDRPRRNLIPRSEFLRQQTTSIPPSRKNCRLDTSDRPECQAFPPRYKGLIPTWNLAQALHSDIPMVVLPSVGNLSHWIATLPLPGQAASRIPGQNHSLLTRHVNDAVFLYRSNRPRRADSKSPPASSEHTLLRN